MISATPPSLRIRASTARRKARRQSRLSHLSRQRPFLRIKSPLDSLRLPRAQSMEVLLTVTYKLKIVVREVAVPSESAVAPPVWMNAVQKTLSQQAIRQPKKSLTLHLIIMIVGKIASLSVVIRKVISTLDAVQTEKCSKQPLWAVWINPHWRMAPALKRPASARDQSPKTGETAMRRQRSSSHLWTRLLITRVRSWGLRIKNLRPRQPLRKQKGPPDRRRPRPTLA